MGIKKQKIKFIPICPAMNGYKDAQKQFHTHIYMPLNATISKEKQKEINSYEKRNTR